MSSILTNTSATVALQTLKSINSDLSSVQSEIATGKSVASAKDNAVDIMIGERVIARGILQESDGNGRRQLSVKLTEVKHPDSDV